MYLAFGLALFPVTGIMGVGQFVYDKGLFSWLGWTQLVVLIGQCVTLALLRETIGGEEELVGADDVVRKPKTQYLTIVAIFLLLMGVGLYMYGIVRTVPK